MMKPIIAFDMDDVLVDSTEFWRIRTNELAGLNLTREHWRVPGEYSKYYESVWETHGASHLIDILAIDKLMEADQSGLQAMPEALDVLYRLKKHYDFVVVTARNESQESETKKWIERAYPGLFNTVYFANESKGLAAKNKGRICRELGASWLLDDNPGHCITASEEGVEAVLFGEYGWHVDVPENMVRCRTWKDVERYFDAETGRQ